MIRVNSQIKIFFQIQITPFIIQIIQIQTISSLTPIMQTNQTQQLQSKLNNLSISQPKQTEEKTFYFETQTKRLKEYYLRSQNQSKLLSQRILFNNSIGIVRYIGQLKHQGAQTNSKQLWLGVQWQQPNRGKHNGTVKGFQYFVCPPNQGSLVKYEKIQFGYRLETALFRRYFKSEEMLHAKNIYQQLRLFKKQINQKKNSLSQDQQTNAQTITQKTNETQKPEVSLQTVQKRRQHKIQYDAQAYFDSLKKSKKIMVEFVGFDQIWTKINNLDKIQSISLPDCRICDLGPKGHLNDLLKSLKILSLEDNLLSTYNQVFQLGYQLPQLQELSLTNNRLAQPEVNFQHLKRIDITGYDSYIDLIEGQPVFQKLKTLVLINTGLKWKTLFKIIKGFNKLKQLVLCRNDLTDYQNIDLNKMSSFDELAFLNLEETNLADFKNIICFKDLPKLQKLTLNKNPITEFGRDITGFHSLKMLSIQSCKVNKSVVIYELSNFKNVQNFNFKHNPLNQLMGNAYVRLRSIAEFQKLTIINGAPLKKYERKDSQIYYMRETFREYFALKNRPDYDYDFEDFIKWCNDHHPNIHLFIKRYGNPYEVEQKKQIKEIIKNEVKQTEMKKGTGMVKVKIHFEQLDKRDERKLPMTWTLVNLKNFFAKTIKVPAGQQHLRHKNQSQKIDQEMTEDHKQLSFYNITQESVLIVKRKNPKGSISFVV